MSTAVDIEIVYDRPGQDAGFIVPLIPGNPQHESAF
jgi:hypothetical protein